MKKEGFFIILALILASFFIPLTAFGWESNSSLEIFSKADSAYEESPQKIISDNKGGFIVGISSSYRCFLQRIDQNGNMLWPQGGVPVSINSTDQKIVDIAPTGDGGCLILWNEGGARIQKIRPDGSWGLGSTGKRLSLLSLSTVNAYKAISDGENGLICFGFDSEYGSVNVGLYAQKINHNGDFCWDTGGIFLGRNYGYPVFFGSDEKGGFLAAGRSSIPMTLRYQHINRNGIACWTYGGVTISPTTTYGSFPDTKDYRYPKILSDGADGAVLTWQWATFYPGSLVAQHIGSQGELLWTGRGLTLSTTIFASNSSPSSNLWKDKDNNFYVIWNPFGVQKFNLQEQISWQENGINVVSPDTYVPSKYVCTEDGLGNLITLTGDSNYSLKIQKLDDSGNRIWGDSAISPGVINPYRINMVLDNTGGAFILWQESNNGPLYARRIYRDGQFITNVSVPFREWKILE